MAKKVEPVEISEKILPNKFFEMPATYHFSKPVLKNCECREESSIESLSAALRMPKLLAMSQKALSYDDGFLKFDREDAKAAGIADQDFELLDANFQVANQLISNGSFKLDAGLTISALLPAFWKVTLIDVTINGEKYVLESEITLLGTQYYISKALINKISQLLALGAGAAGVAAALQAAGIITAPSAAITGVIAAILAFGAAALQFLDFCNGVYVLIPFSGIPPMVPYPA
jgi:hypothetical protein